MKALLLPLALLCACGDGTPVELSTSAATPSTDGETAEEVKLAPIGRGYWNASLVSPDGAPAGVVSEDGKRTMSWEVRVGEGIEFLTFGFIGSGQARVISRSNVNGEKSLLISVELDEFSAEDVVGELRYLGAPKETVDQLRLDLGEARALRSKTTVTGRFVATSATGYVPGSLRDAGVWTASQRQATAQVGSLGQPVLLASEIWDDSQGSARYSGRDAYIGPGERVEVSLKVNGEPTTLTELEAPAWGFYLLAE